jgi:HAE1 family hydrophobic/amphiphilic exporter-1
MVLLSIADIFIKRPVLTTVCTILIVLIGGVCIPLLPINYLPDIAPIQVQVASTYTGADVETVENTTTTILERQINGVDRMQYMTSSSFTGNSQISVYFPSNTDKDIDQVNVQNRVSQALPRLPSTVQQQGVTTKTASTSILLVYGIYSENNAYDDIFISNYVDLYITDVIKRVSGVGDLVVFGNKQNAMRLWLDPDALAGRGLTVQDVADALRSQNIVVGAGTIGAEPIPKGQKYEFPVRVQGRLRDPAEFENLVLKVQRSDDTQPTLVKLSDVGRAEIGAEDYSSNAKVNGNAGIGMVIYQTPGSNALDVASNIQAQMAELIKDFPPGMKADIVYDTTAFINVSIEEVFKTLFEAFLLVVLVIFVFLQDWRTTIIPLIAIPVSLIGAMAIAFVFGFSVNNLTLFGLILATGLVVDDAIIVVEAVSAKIEQGMKPMQATIDAMQELTGAVIATSLVLMAVFIPVAFFPGSTGKLYQQFALVIAFSIAISTFNALSFSPSISAILLRPKREGDGEGRGPLAWFFRQFNRILGWVIARYKSAVEFLIRIRYLVVVLFVAGLFATFLMFKTVPTGFVPDEDQGTFLGIVQAPDGVSLSYTDHVLDQARELMQKQPEVISVFTASGRGFDGNGSSKGLFFTRLKPWDERPGNEHSMQTVLGRVNKAFAGIQDAVVIALNLPPIPGFSATGGFELQLQDRTGGKISINDFTANANEMIGKANQNPALSRTYTTFTAGTPQLEININRDKLEALNVDFQQAVQAVASAIGSQYVNDYVLGTRSYRVYVQADGDYRQSPADLSKLYVRSLDDKLVSLGEVATVTPYTGPQIINHYNGYRSIKLQGAQAPGHGSGEALQVMNQVVKETALPGIGSDWTGIAREQLAAGNLGMLIFGFGLIMVFLTLAAQYESYIDPIIILLTVPLALLGALGALFLRGLVNDVYANVALVMLIGLAAKNAILIVEFANLAREQGMSIARAAVTAAEERFRPIVMTAFAALAGFWPLVVATGAGAASRVSLGTALFGGLLVATVLSLLIVPVLYVIIKSLADRFLGGRTDPPTSPPSSSNGGPARETRETAAESAMSADTASQPDPQSNPRFQGDAPA